MLSLLFLAPAASASGGYNVGISTVDYVSDIVYHANGTVSYGSGHGFYTIDNPAPTSPLISVDVTSYSGSLTFIGNIAPLSGYSGAYDVDHDNIRIPLIVKETITPASLTAGLQQQVNITVEVTNVASHDVTGFDYTKTIPSNLVLIGDSYDSGTLVSGSNVTWHIDSISPSATCRMNMSFYVTPSSAISFPASYILYTADDSSASGNFGFSGTTVTTFSLQKSNPYTNAWDVHASFPDDSEFNMSLSQANIYRSNVNDPFNMVLVRNYAPDVQLEPGESWDTSFTDIYDQTPAYFMKVAYQIPYTVNHTSQPLTPAETDPFTIAVQGASTGGTIPDPYVPTGPTAVMHPTATPQPYVAPLIVFVNPKPDSTIHTNNTTLEAWITIPESSGFVVFYSSRDNESWTYLSRSSIVDNTARYTWDLPDTNGRYYLKAEYYNDTGMVGETYLRILVQHESAPVDISKFFSQTADWAVLLTVLALLLLITLFVLPPLVYKPVLYDLSALRLLSVASIEEILRLPRALRPNNVDIPAFKGSERIRPREVKKTDEQKRFESEYGMQPYDAAVLELAKERGLKIYSGDPRMIEFYESMGVKSERVEKLLRKVGK